MLLAASSDWGTEEGLSDGLVLLLPSEEGLLASSLGADGGALALVVSSDGDDASSDGALVLLPSLGDTSSVASFVPCSSRSRLWMRAWHDGIRRRDSREIMPKGRLYPLIQKVLLSRLLDFLVVGWK